MEVRSDVEGFFTRNQGRLLNIAVWAKYLAWVVLAVAMVATILRIVIDLGLLNAQYSGLGNPSMDFAGLFRADPSAAISLLLDFVRSFFQAWVYFLVLQGISLGLSMIAETDMNYREKAGALK
jgi:hypothetical protein